jgi:hypothetical protein
LWLVDSDNAQVEIRELVSTYERPQVLVPNPDGGADVPKSFKDDPIRKYSQVTLDAAGTVAGVALRESGHVDFYWNRSLADMQESAPNYGKTDCCLSSETVFKDMNAKKITENIANFRFKDVEIDFETIYLTTVKTKMQNVGEDEEIEVTKTFKVSLNKESKIGMQTAKYDEFYDHSMQPVIHNVIKENVRLYSSFLQENTLLFITHCNIVSIYSMVIKKWEHVHFSKNSYI